VARPIPELPPVMSMVLSFIKHNIKHYSITTIRVRDDKSLSVTLRE